MRRIISILAIALGPTPPGRHTPKPRNPLPDSPTRDWQASWITHPTVPFREPSGAALSPRAFAGRRARHLSRPGRRRQPLHAASYEITVGSATVPHGATWLHWRYERFDLAPLLPPGPNLITATVWNFGTLAPLAQISDRTAFLLESETGDGANAITTGVSSHGIHRSAHSDGLAGRDRNRPSPADRSTPSTPSDVLGFRPRRRSRCRPLRLGLAIPLLRCRSLAPRRLTHARQHLPRRQSRSLSRRNRRQSLGTRSRSTPAYGDTSADDPRKGRRRDISSHSVELQWFRLISCPRAASPAFAIPHGSLVHLLLDRKTLTTAYPALTTSGGKGAKITLTYAEALYDQNQQKGDRDEVRENRARRSA